MNVVKWTYLWIIILVHGLSASDLSIAEIQATGRVLFRALRDSDCKIKCSNKQRRPVCGSDGITYASKCELMKAKRCDKRNISIQKKGKCSGSRGTTKCQQERSEAQKIARRPTAGIFIPECKKDGAYMEIQCHAATSFCWCVTKEGRPISGTSLQGKKPSCKGKQRSKKSFRAKDRLRKKKKRACTQSDRNEFNKNLLQTFIKEYERAMSLSSSSSNLKKKRGDSANNSRNKRVAEWKFSELDKNKDNKLRRKEVRTLKRMVKKVIKPRACAKTFISYCDLDQNKRIEREEWTLCLGVDINSPWGRGRTKVDTQDQSRKKPKDPPPVIEENHNSLIDILPGNSKIWPPKGLTPHQPSNTPPPDTDDKSRSCIEEREAALKQNQQDPSGGTFIPSCTNTGQWSQAQCHNSSGYCWCVDESTGVPIPGTSTLKVLPKCDVVKIQREMKGCPFSKKRRFLSDLLQYIIKQMNTSNPLNVLNVGGSVDTSPEAAVEWKFRNLDSNSNLILERKELKKLRKDIPQTKDTRRCRRNFIRYCDENKDRKVSKKEWIGCMDTSGSAALPLPEDPRRRGPNPFSKYLSPN